ncbi:hypothetical protein ACFOYU_10255 [Microvirga sp. GCM10011540]|uniref:hypothetical protein n=1 Tax=Microvirga sp. GCM10011540 TaxID=3317338 RepID=UPI003608DB1B
MSAVWNHLRRFVASLVLVAMASFVLHGGAMAALQAHDGGPARGAHATHTKDADRPHPECADRVVTAVAPDGCVHGAGGPDHDGSEGPHSPHCGMVCGLALPSGSLGPVPVPATAAVCLPLESQRGSGIDPNGLKRPPRTPCIA